MNNEHSGGNKLTPLVVDSGLVMSLDNPYSGNVLEVIANLTSRNARIVGIAGLLHPSILGILQSLQLRAQKKILVCFVFIGLFLPREKSVNTTSCGWFYTMWLSSTDLSTFNP